MATIDSSRRVRVFVRTRPTGNFAHDRIGIGDDGKTISIHQPKNERCGVINNQIEDWSFQLDGILHNSSQLDVYHTCASSVVTQVMEGFNGTVLAYGQTGAGKTYTMSGELENYQLRGIIPRAISQVFQEIKERTMSSITVRVSYLEIYNETMTDLLATLPASTGSDELRSSSEALTISRDESRGILVKGLTIRMVNNEEEALNMFFEGGINRLIGNHILNQHSSRSHCVFTIYVESHSYTSASAEYMVSKLNLVDLAGSERLCKTKSVGVTQKEAVHINKSLLFLEQVVLALADSKRDHVPFRQSKLTHVLQDSLGGNCSTVMIANIWGEAAQMEETVSTLRFAARMMRVPIIPVVNRLQDPMLLLRKYEQEITLLKQELAMHDTLANRSIVSHDPIGEQELSSIKSKVKEILDGTGDIQAMEFASIRQIKEIFLQCKEFISAAKQDHQHQTQLLQDQISKLQQDVQKLKPLEMQLQQAQQQQHQQQQGTLQQQKGRESVEAEEGGTSSTLKIPSSGSRAGGKFFKKRQLSDVESQRRTPSVDEENVGESSGHGIPVGQAPSNMKASGTSLLSSRKTGIGRTARVSILESPSVLNKKRMSIARGGTLDAEIYVEEGNDTLSSPPSRAVAFDVFKNLKGIEMSKVLRQNKELLQKKKKERHELSIRINSIKRKIDEAQAVEKQKIQHRDEHGTITTSEGRLVIDEEEFFALNQLKELKTEYLSTHDAYRLVNEEITYCEQYVTKSRERLIQEFDKWYKESYIKQEDKSKPEEPPCEVTVSTETDDEAADHDKFERLQSALLKGDPSASAFYHAQLRTQKRALEFPQKRKPGQIIQSVRNNPPGIITFN